MHSVLESAPPAYGGADSINAGQNRSGPPVGGRNPAPAPRVREESIVLGPGGKEKKYPKQCSRHSWAARRRSGLRDTQRILQIPVERPVGPCRGLTARRRHLGKSDPGAAVRILFFILCPAPDEKNHSNAWYTWEAGAEQRTARVRPRGINLVGRPAARHRAFTPPRGTQIHPALSLLRGTHSPPLRGNMSESPR
jgi:hypothetical protein